ncbi:hypothetical protein G4B88_022719 [Cannabis sativa]|uniref:Uncharacterized protein n=1 Tax=Cannabis sativa TaxID=3483 RepID=A0A7J6HWP3_CANSA|nr:hypothetical protein G4B88_022719 [Cannabis sativa]
MQCTQSPSWTDPSSRTKRNHSHTFGSSPIHVLTIPTFHKPLGSELIRVFPHIRVFGNPSRVKLNASVSRYIVPTKFRILNSRV